MKKILTILIFFFACKAYSQPIVNRSSSNNTVQDGRLAALYNLFIPRYADTTAANLQKGIDTCGAIVFTYNNNSFWKRACSPKRWVKIADMTDITNITGCNALLNGGVVTWTGSGLVFDVSPAAYIIDCGGIYNSPQTQITLSAADPSNPRLDVIAVNTSGAVVVLTGTPAANPAKPQVDPSTQLELTVVLIPAGATTPGGIATEIIYDENIEWTTSSSGVTVDFDNTVAPFHLTKAASTGAVTSTSTLSFTKTTAVNLASYSVLKIYLRLKAAFNQNTQFQVYWTNTTGAIDVVVGSMVVSNNNYGYTRTTVGSYQIITIPISDFNLLSSNADVLSIRTTGSNASGYYADYIQLQSGIPSGTQPYMTDVYRKTGTDSVFKVINNIPSFAFIDSTGGGGSLTATYIGFGSALNALTGSNKLTWDNNNENLIATGSTVDAGAFGNFIFTHSGIDSGLNTGMLGGQNTVVRDGVVGAVSVATDSKIYSTADYGFVANDANEISGESESSFGFGNKSWNTNGFTAGQDNLLGAITGNGTGNQYVSGIMLATQGRSTGDYTFTVGRAVQTQGTSAMAIGSGINSTNTRMVNSTANSLAIGFNSNIPTLHILPASGSGTYGTVGIGTSTPSALLHINGASGFRYVDGNQAAGRILVSDANGVGSWATSASALTVPISSLTAALAYNDINNTNFPQYWRWTGLNDVGLNLESSSTAATASNHILFRALTYGANAASSATTYGGYFSNTHSGTSSTNVGGLFSASGATNNYGILVPNGSVGIGTPTPTSLLHVVSPVTTGIGANFTSSTVTSGSIVDITNTSTAATGGTQKSLNISLTGVNANASEATYGIYSSNTRTGGGINTAGYFTANGGLIDRAVHAATTSSGAFSVYATSALDGTSVYGVNVGNGGFGGIFENQFASAGTGYGLWGSSTGAKTTGIGGYFTSVNATNNHAIIVPANNGNVGIGTSAPTATRLEVVDDGLAGASMVSLTSTSTAAASNSQIGLSVDLSGTNATASQTTKAINAQNNHAGTGANNFAGYFTSTNGAANTGVFGSGSTVGVHGSSSTVGVKAETTTGTGLNAISSDGLPMSLSGDFTSTNTVGTVLSSTRNTTGTAAAGLGSSYDMYLETSTGATALSNQIISKWTTATNGSQVSQLVLSGVNAAVTGDILTLNGNKSIKANGYGSGTFTGTATKFLAVDADGDIIEEDAPSGGAAWNDITDPTGDQALTFDAGESSTWTNSNTTEDLMTINTSTLTTGSLLSLNSTSTALAAGNNLAEFVMSGANGTNAITATGLRVSVTNTNATSGTNIGLDVTASGATTNNFAVKATGKSIFTGNVVFGEGEPVDVGSNEVVTIRSTNNVVRLYLQESGDAGTTGLELNTVNGYANILNRKNTPMGFHTNAIERMTIAAAGTVTMSAYTAGTATFDGSGNITSVSDRRAKHSISKFNYGLAAIKKLKTSSFIYNQDKSNTIMSGFIAQDVKKAIPIAVHESKDKDGMMSLETNAILAAAVNAIQELSAKVDRLEKEIKKLKAKK